jgi:sialidase-1
MLKDGTLVFAAQFKKDIGVPAIDGGKYTSHSTILYSKDKGQTWAIGTGAKPNTTEAQVVELADGSLMLNMRDDRNRKEKGANNGRAVAITTDLGKTWRVHSSSNGALPEPNCMASIIRVDCKIDGKKKPVLFFSNPNSKNSRSNMSIQTSFDEGATWPENRKFLYNANDCYGYSCLTQIDSNTIGVLYEGAGDLYFQKFKIKELVGNK